MDKNSKILVTDDSAFMRSVLIDILGEVGFSNFIQASNGKEALEKYEAEKPDLLILDLIMPEMDGMEVLRSIGNNARVLMVSAVGQDAMIDEAKNLGAKDYIVKPFDKEKIIEKMQEFLNEN
jgi:two-component system chemotaxis response regulator CheY